MRAANASAPSKKEEGLLTCGGSCNRVNKQGSLQKTTIPRESNTQDEGGRSLLRAMLVCIQVLFTWNSRIRLIWGFPKIRGTLFGGSV